MRSAKQDLRRAPLRAALGLLLLAACAAGPAAVAGATEPAEPSPARVELPLAPRVLVVLPPALDPEPLPGARAEPPPALDAAGDPPVFVVSRPAGMPARPAPAAAPAPEPDPAPEPAAGPSAIGIQLMAVRDGEAARAAADRLEQAGEGALAGRRLIVRAGAAGFHRVQAGPFPDRAEARAACAALRALSPDCFVVTDFAAGG